LLRLRIDRVKASAIQEAEESLMTARISFEKLRDTTASALWLSDLVDFDKVWAKAKIERVDFLSGAGSTTAEKQKKRRFKVAA
jgi:head-tail adaptor